MLLASNSISLMLACTSAVSTNLEQSPISDASMSAGGTLAGRQRNAEVMVPHAALLSRHHMECVSFWMVVLQLTQRIRDHRAQQGSSPNSGLGGQSAADQLLPADLAARQFPAHLQKMLQQLGISSSAAVWAVLKCAQVLGRLHAIDSTLWHAAWL